MPSITRKTASGRTRRDAVQAELLDAVERLLEAGESYTSLGVQRICDEAGVARSAFYSNFANKSELLLAALESVMENVFAESRGWALADPPPGKKALEATMANTLRNWRAHAPVLRAYFEVSAYDTEVAHFWRGQFASVIDAMQKRIESEQHRRRIPKRLDPRIMAEFIVYSGERLAAEHIATNDATHDPALARQTAEIIWRILYGT